MAKKDKAEQSVFLVITSAVVVGVGEIAKKDEIIEVTEREARSLLHRGKARLATDEDMPARKRATAKPEA